MLIRTIDTYDRDLEHVADLSITATFYHSRIWIESLAATFPRLSFRCLVSQTGDSVSGFLPYFIIRRGPLHTAWSLPFGTYGGPVALSSDAAAELIDAHPESDPYVATYFHQHATLAVSSARYEQIRWLSGQTLVLPPPGSAVFAGEREVGSLSSVGESLELRAPVGLALIRREVEPGGRVELRWEQGSVPARVEELPLDDFAAT